MLLKVDCLPNAVGKQPSIPLINLGRNKDVKLMMMMMMMSTLKVSARDHPFSHQFPTGRLQPFSSLHFKYMKLCISIPPLNARNFKLIKLISCKFVTLVHCNTANNIINS